MWKSSDRGRSWTVLEIVEPSFAAYSDLLQLSKTELGVLYESADYDQIIFKRIEINLAN